MPLEFLPDGTLDSMDQIGIVVEDIESSIEQYSDLFGIKPWVGYRFTPPILTNTYYRGTETTFGMLIALANTGDIQIELIEPLHGENIYFDHLEEHGEGLHHIAKYVPDDDHVKHWIDHFQSLDIPLIQRGSYGETHFYYFDTPSEANGLIFEVVNRTTKDRKPAFEYPEGQ